MTWVIMAYRGDNPAITKVTGPRNRAIRNAHQMRQKCGHKARIRVMSEGAWFRLTGRKPR